MENVYIPEATSGNWRVEKFTTDRMDLRSLASGRGVPLGKTYTRMMCGSTLVMSDTPAEMRDHSHAVHNAKGSCLINGLGIGMVLKNILLKDSVTDVTVVELSQDVINMVAPHYNDPRVAIVCESAFDYQPPKGKEYGMVWHDIWNYICGDNIEEMKKLHRKYGRRTEWQGSWCRGECERANRPGRW